LRSKPKVAGDNFHPAGCMNQEQASRQHS